MFMKQNTNKYQIDSSSIRWKKNAHAVKVIDLANRPSQMSISATLAQRSEMKINTPAGSLWGSPHLKPLATGDCDQGI